MDFTTYTCFLSDNRIEIGHAFLAQAGDEDTLFDVILGEFTSQTAEGIEPLFGKMRWVGVAICAAVQTQGAELVLEGPLWKSGPYQRDVGEVLEYGIEFTSKGDEPSFRAVLGEQRVFNSDAMEVDYQRYGWVAGAVVHYQG
jgi:hypothetical protein